MRTGFGYGSRVARAKQAVSPYRLDRDWHSDEGDRALDVVGEDVEAGFDCHISEPSQNEVASADPVIQRAEDMLGQR